MKLKLSRETIGIWSIKFFENFILLPLPWFVKEWYYDCRNSQAAAFKNGEFKPFFSEVEEFWGLMVVILLVILICFRVFK
jgi:hypothetical protein